MTGRLVVLALAVLALVAAGALVLAGGDTDPGGPEPAPAPPALSVVTSTNVYSAVATAVGGNRVRALPVVIDANALPRSYEASPSDAGAVAEANVVVYNGDGYDEFMNVLLDASGGRPVPVNVAEMSGLAPPGGGPFNEHVWYSLPTMRALAARLAGEFGKIDPAGAGDYGASATVFATRIGELIARANAIEATHGGARVVVTDTVPGYLIEESGLVDVTPEQFISANDSPPRSVLEQTLGLFRTDPVRALIVNAQAGSPAVTQVEQAAAAAGVPIVRMTETMPVGSKDYHAWMGRQLDELAAALDRPR